MSGRWLREDFETPARLDLPTGHHLRPIRERDVDIDYPAVMGSRERLWARYGAAWGWPPATMTYEADREDLARHEREIEAQETFNYAVLDEGETELLGCVYIDPPDAEHPGADAVVSWWVVDAHARGPLQMALDVPAGEGGVVDADDDLGVGPRGHRDGVTRTGEQGFGGVVGVGVGGFAPPLGAGSLERAVGAVADGVVHPGDGGHGAGEVEVPGHPVGVGRGPAGALGVGAAGGRVGVALGVDAGAAALVLQLAQRAVLGSVEEAVLGARIGRRGAGDGFGLAGGEVPAGHCPSNGGELFELGAGVDQPFGLGPGWCRSGGPATPRGSGRRRRARSRCGRPGRRPGS